jgi:hypothetical protein
LQLQYLAIHVLLVHDPADRHGHLPLGSRIFSTAPGSDGPLWPLASVSSASGTLAWWQIRGALLIPHGIEIVISTWESISRPREGVDLPDQKCLAG